MIGVSHWRECPVRAHVFLGIDRNRPLTPEDYPGSGAGCHELESPPLFVKVAEYGTGYVCAHS